MFPPEDNWPCVEPFLTVTTVGMVLSGGQRAEMLPNILLGSGQPPTTKNYPAHNVNSAKVKNP